MSLTYLNGGESKYNDPKNTMCFVALLLWRIPKKHATTPSNGAYNVSTALTRYVNRIPFAALEGKFSEVPCGYYSDWQQSSPSEDIQNPMRLSLNLITHFN